MTCQFFNRDILGIRSDENVGYGRLAYDVNTMNIFDKKCKISMLLLECVVKRK